MIKIFQVSLRMIHARFYEDTHNARKTWKRAIILSTLMLGGSGINTNLMAQISDPSKDPAAHPWQLTDFTGTLSRRLMSNNDWVRFERLEPNSIGRYFTWGDWPGSMVQVSEDPRRQLYYSSIYKGRVSGRTYHWWNYKLDAIDASVIPDIPHIFYQLVGTGVYKKIYAVATGKSVRSFLGTGSCGAGDNTWLFAGDTSYHEYDVSYKMEDVGGGKRILTDESGHHPFRGDTSTERSPSIVRGPSMCGAGNVINAENKFFIHRYTKNVPSIKAYYPLDDQSKRCAVGDAYCAEWQHTSFTTDRFGRARSAIAFDKKAPYSFFEFPTALVDELTTKKEFSIGFWARVGDKFIDGDNFPQGRNYTVRDYVNQNGLHALLLYGLSHRKDADHIVAGLSISVDEYQLSLNRSSYAEPVFDNIVPDPSGNSPEDLTHKLADWKFWLPPEFHLGNPDGTTGTRWVYMLLAYGPKRTTIYLHDPIKTSGDFGPRFTKKYYILMDNALLEDIDKLGFGLANNDLLYAFPDAIDDVTVFNANLADNESDVRAALNEAILGGYPLEN